MQRFSICTPVNGTSLTHVVILSLIKEASMHPKQTKKRSISADAIRQVTEVCIVSCDFDVF